MSRRTAMTSAERRAMSDALRSITRAGNRPADLRRMLVIPRHVVGTITRGVGK